MPLVYLWWWADGWRLLSERMSAADGITPARGYVLAALVVASVQLAEWLRRRVAGGPPEAVVRHHIYSVDIAARLGRWPARGLKAGLLSYVPGNQLFQLDIDEEEVELERLPPELAGLSLLHLSDLHFSGIVEPAFFHEVVRLANELAPDMVAITGDICDFAGGIAWVKDIFAGLRAPAGKFFVLGNHDLLTRDVPGLRAALAAVGFTDVASAPARLQVRGYPVVVAGNERPWFRSPDPVDLLPPGRSAPLPLRILLAHTPDQFQWARQRDFDLMLAGHTHGGQIRLPGIGPVVCPSLHGVRYASGTFYARPTLLHVSRGVSSLLPLRLSCPCEITKLVLQRPRTAG